MRQFWQLLIEHRKSSLKIWATMATNPTEGYLTSPKFAGMMDYGGRDVHFYYWCEDGVTSLSLDQVIDYVMIAIDNYVQA